MTNQTEKNRRKEILNQLKQKEKTEFLDSLPMRLEIFQELFDYLDGNLGEGCDNDMTLTIRFLEEKKVENVEHVIEWLNENGGYCDCEVLANVEDKFQ